MLTDALISPCGSYRYWLSRVWDASLPASVWIMLNPSTADASQDDPTIRRVIGFSRAWGCGSATVYNLFALRSTSPVAIRSHADPVGPDNDRHLAGIPPRARIVAAWGQHGAHRDRCSIVCSRLAAAGVRLSCLGTTQSGQPKHPLYIAAATKLVPFPGTPITL
jgi:hypothetical protein